MPLEHQQVDSGLKIWRQISHHQVLLLLATESSIMSLRQLGMIVPDLHSTAPWTLSHPSFASFPICSKVSSPRCKTECELVMPLTCSATLIVIDFFLLQGRCSLRLHTAAEAGRWSEQYKASTYIFSRMTHFQGNNHIFIASYFIMRVYLYKIGIGIYMQFVFLQFNGNLIARLTQTWLKMNVGVAPFCIFVKWFSIRTLLDF